MSKIYLSAAFDEEDLQQAISLWDYEAVLQFFKDIELRIADQDFAECVVRWGQELYKEIKDDIEG